MKMSQLGEQGFLKEIERFICRSDVSFLELGFGDDAAIIKSARGSGRIVVTTDMLIEGVHFSKDLLSFHNLGRKSYEVNASDLAAMGAWPVLAFLSLGLPPETPVNSVKDFYKGFCAGARRHHCRIAGGDTVRAGCWSVSVTLIGKYNKGGRPLLRSGARQGDYVYITGWPGESGLGLRLLQKGKRKSRGKDSHRLIMRHNQPRARILEAITLARSCKTGAAIDVSDGVMHELRIISRLSEVKILIDITRLPISLTLKSESARLGIDPLDMVLYGGEDYELLFTTSLPLEKVRERLKKAGSRVPVHEIGRVERGSGIEFFDYEGRLVPFKDKTFEHFSGRSG